MDLEPDNLEEREFVTIDFHEEIYEKLISNPFAIDNNISKGYPVIDDVTIDDFILPDVNLTSLDEDSLLVKIDTLTSNPYWPKLRNDQLKTVQKLLDSLLISHPEYRKYILAERSKFLSNETLPFTKQQKQLDTYLVDFLRKNYPEGADYGIYDKLNPGVNIPIDKLINLIGHLF